MKMISYWKNVKLIYEDNGLSLITGYYNHKNQDVDGYKTLGVYWDGNYPQSRGVLSPCVIPKETRDAILFGLLHQAVIQKNIEAIDKIKEAIQFFK